MQECLPQFVTLEGQLRILTAHYDLKMTEHSTLHGKPPGSAFPPFFVAYYWKLSKTTDKYEHWKRSNL